MFRLALSTGWILLALDRTLASLYETNQTLTSRVDQLATLHAIGREIPSSVDPRRVFGIIERECRKIFEVDDYRGRGAGSEPGQTGVDQAGAVG